MQGRHVVDMDAPAPDLGASLKAMEDTMAKLKIGTVAGGGEAPSLPEGVASAAAAASTTDDSRTGEH